MEAVYAELRHLAHSQLRRERPGNTLQSTALVHEAYLRLIVQKNVIWQNRAHFFGIASHMMRRILVDHARSRQPSKRGAGISLLTLDEAVAMVRRECPETLRRRLSGDLDNIVLKALQKDPARRYVSVAQFSEDISRRLDGLPVIARRVTFGYRASKFVKRHRFGVAAAAAIFSLLIAGMIATTWLVRVARVQREIANRRFEDMRSITNSLLFESHDSIKDLPGSTPARKLVVTRALEYQDGFNQDVKGDASLQRELAVAYLKVGDVQGQPRQANLGDRDGAESSYRKGLAICEAPFRNPSPEPLFCFALSVE